MQLHMKEPSTVEVLAVAASPVCRPLVPEPAPCSGKGPACKQESACSVRCTLRLGVWCVPILGFLTWPVFVKRDECALTREQLGPHSFHPSCWSM